MKYTIELSDDLATVYEDIARINNMPVEEALQRILGRVIETMTKERSGTRQ